jgi:RNA polymerase sigma-70 factor (ECF subfamily)
MVTPARWQINSQFNSAFWYHNLQYLGRNHLRFKTKYMTNPKGGTPSIESQLKEGMKRAQEGDAEAYRSLLESARVILKVYASRSLLRMGINDPQSADDLVQETLLAIHTKRHTYDATQLFTPWLFAIARYKLIDFGRRRRRGAGQANMDSLEDDVVAPVFSEPGAERDLNRLLESLPAAQRKLVEWIKIDGLSVAEASARTHLSESAVKVRVHRAMKLLKAKAKEDPGHDERRAHK